LKKLKESKNKSNSGDTRPDSRLLKAVESVYSWIDTKNQRENAGCKQCGKCCDFAHFDQHLYVTTPEMIYLAAGLGAGNILQMEGKLCPYNKKGQCTIRDYRFSGCRIFFCGGDAALLARLSEDTIRQFRRLCEEFKLPYRYMPLKAALSEMPGLLPI
jgi:Fe-S-cluster containining protein